MNKTLDYLCFAPGNARKASTAGLFLGGHPQQIIT
jgi:hypothetical protein